MDIFWESLGRNHFKSLPVIQISQAHLSLCPLESNPSILGIQTTFHQYSTIVLTGMHKLNCPQVFVFNQI